MVSRCFFTKRLWFSHSRLKIGLYVILLNGFEKVVPMAKVGMTHSNIDQRDRPFLDSKFWIKEFTWTRDGFCYTLNSTIRVGNDYENSAIVFYANDVDMHQIIYIHDPDFFVINDNPMALPKIRIKVMAKSFQYHRIFLVEHSLLNHPKIPCEPRRDYSFRGCVRNSFTEKVKCRLPWPATDPSVDNGLPVCQSLTQFLHFEKLYAQIEEVSTSSIENITKCLRPCHYKEYRMVNVPTAISETNTEFSSIFMFWFVSTETLVEEQSLVYPWQTLVVQLISDQNKLDHAFSKSSGGWVWRNPWAFYWIQFHLPLGNNGFFLFFHQKPMGWKSYVRIKIISSNMGGLGFGYDNCWFGFFISLFRVLLKEHCIIHTWIKGTDIFAWNCTELMHFVQLGPHCLDLSIVVWFIHSCSGGNAVIMHCQGARRAYGSRVLVCLYYHIYSCYSVW